LIVFALEALFFVADVTVFCACLAVFIEIRVEPSSAVIDTLTVFKEVFGIAFFAISHIICAADITVRITAFYTNSINTDCSNWAVCHTVSIMIVESLVTFNTGHAIFTGFTILFAGFASSCCVVSPKLVSAISYALISFKEETLSTRCTFVSRVASFTSVGAWLANIRTKYLEVFVTAIGYALTILQE
jgi:hypothetical protein